ncbi:MAG: tetratricopeptide repeat protein [Bdellovibrionota bacterium]
MIDQVSDDVKTEQWIRGLKILSTFVVVAAIFLAGYAFWMKKQESKTLQAFSSLAEADVIEMRALRDVKVLSQDPVEALRDGPAAQKSAYVAALEKVRAEHHGTTASVLAALRLGRWFIQNNDLAKAESIYKDVLGEIRGRDSDVYVSMASEALGVVYEDQNRLDEALKIYNSALTNDKATLRPLLLLGKARVLSSMKKPTEAKTVYDIVVEDYPNSAYSQQARALAVKAEL